MSFERKAKAPSAMLPSSLRKSLLDSFKMVQGIKRPEISISRVSIWFNDLGIFCRENKFCQSIIFIFFITVCWDNLSGNKVTNSRMSWFQGESSSGWRLHARLRRPCSNWDVHENKLWPRFLVQRRMEQGQFFTFRV